VVTRVGVVPAGPAAEPGPAFAVRAHDVFSLYPTPRGHVAALRGLTLDVAAGERVVVHGPNGSGKTTLMRVLIAELIPSAGTVDVCGVDLIGAGEAERARLRATRIGLVDQHYGRGLRPEISVLDNVALQLRVAGTGRRAARDRAAVVLAELGLSQLAHRRPSTLSGGEAQRVCVCAAVAHAPALVLADEPTGELDRESADEVYDLLAAAAATSGAALLVVSHDARATRVADRIVRIRDGRLSEEWRNADAGTESLVVDDRGWVRLPEALRRTAGVISRARAELSNDAIVLSSAPDGVGVGAVPVDEAGRATVDGAGMVPVDQAGAVPVDGAGRRPPGPAAPGPEVARLEGITVRRDGRTVLDRVELRARAGTLTVVQGRSGSGKTTLLRVLCGLERPDAGSVVVAGTDLSTLDRSGLAALRAAHVGVAGQSTVLMETMDTDENLDLIRLARGLPRDDELVESAVRSLGLAAVRGRPVRVLSGGERQRVAVARVLAAGVELSVLDEPTSHQDEAHAEILAAVLVTAARRGGAIVAATHDPVLTAAADEVISLG
jgi:ABC-type lipoprotein export system ATPase subunit